MDTKREGAKQGLPDGWTRWTVITRVDLLEEFKDTAWFEKKTIKDLFEEMLLEFLGDKKSVRQKLAFLDDEEK